MGSTARANGRERAVAWLLAALVFTAVWIAFAPVHDAGFLNWDDDRNVVANFGFRGLSRAHLDWMFSTVEMGPYQPLAWLSLALDHEIAGLDPSTFHRTNVLLHAASAVAFYFLAVELFARARTRSAASVSSATPHAGAGAGTVRSANAAASMTGVNSEARGVALHACAAFAALLFAVHPLRVESVAWVTERRDVLSGFFFVLAAWAYLRWAGTREESIGRASAWIAIAASCAVPIVFFASVALADGNHLAFRGLGGVGLVIAAIALLGATASVARGRRTGWFAVCIALFLAALLSKALVLVLPVLLLVVDVWPLRRAKRTGGTRSFSELVVEKLPLLALSAVFGVIAMWGQKAQLGSVATWEEHTLAERVAQSAYGLWFYAWKTVAPFGLLPIYELPDELSLAEARYRVPALLVVVVTLFVVVKARELPAVACAWIAYLIAIAPVVGFFQTGPQIAADRYSYLACMPFALLAGGGACVLAERRPALRGAVATLGVAIVVMLGAATWRQTRHWRSSESLWTYARATNPASPIAHLNLGDVRLREAQSQTDTERKRALLDEAESLFRAGLALDRDARFLMNLAIVEGERASVEPAERARRFESALATLREAIALAEETNSVVPEMRQTLGLFLFEVGRTDEALEELARYVEARPHDVTGLYNLGLALNRAKRHADAVPCLERALALAPENAALWTQLGIAHFASGDRPRGVATVERALALDPRDEVARSTLAWMRER